MPFQKPSIPDFYKVLGLRFGASSDDVRTAFLNVYQYDPDSEVGSQIT